jgi:hypothetical protein
LYIASLDASRVKYLPGLRTREVEMFKSKAAEKQKDLEADVAEMAAKRVQEQHSVLEQPSPRREPTNNAATRSCIGSGMSIVSRLRCCDRALFAGQTR